MGVLTCPGYNLYGILRTGKGIQGIWKIVQLVRATICLGYYLAGLLFVRDTICTGYYLYGIIRKGKGIKGTRKILQLFRDTTCSGYRFYGVYCMKISSNVVQGNKRQVYMASSSRTISIKHNIYNTYSTSSFYI